MIRRPRLMITLTLVATIAAWSGCGGESAPQAAPESSNPATAATGAKPGASPAPEAPKNETVATAEKPESATKEEKAPEAKAPVEAVVPRALGAANETQPAPASADGVKLTPAKWGEYLAAVKPKDGKKFTLVDAWATWCAPCKENFPHVVEMHEKYGPKGLQVVSLSLDDLSDAKAVKEATEFLVSKKAVFTNLIMNESQDTAFDNLQISAIPSVFLFDAQGKEVHRFTLEDPNDQFTYDQVEKAIEALLDGKPVPDFKKPAAK